MIASILLTACGGSARVIQPDSPTDSVVRDGGDTFVFSSPKLGMKYDECVARAAVMNPELLVTDLEDFSEIDFKEVWWCGDGTIGGDDLIFMSTLGFANLTPGFVDDAVIVGTATLWNGVKVVILLAASYAAGAITGQYYNETRKHSNREHSPDIEGTKARKNIDAFIKLMAAYFGGQGPDPRTKCGVTKQTLNGVETVLRVAIWVADATFKDGGYILWYYRQQPGVPLKGPWGGSYDMSEKNWDEDPHTNQSERDRGISFTSGIDCNSITDTPTFLQAAQPVK